MCELTEEDLAKWVSDFDNLPIKNIHTHPNFIETMWHTLISALKLAHTLITAHEHLLICSCGTKHSDLQKYRLCKYGNTFKEILLNF